MLYRKLEIVCNGAEDRLNRVLEVRSDVDLLTLGYILLTSVSSEIDYAYTIETNNICYVFDSVMDDESIFFETDKELRALSENHLSDLPQTFTLKYFDGDEDDTDYDAAYWSFTIQTEKKEIRRKDNIYARMLDGKGMGIWEGQNQAYFEYLKGNIDPNADEEIDTGEVYVYPPYNLDISTYGECDSGFDLEAAKEDFEEEMDPDELKYLVEEAVYYIETDGDIPWEEYYDDDEDLEGYLDILDIMDDKSMAKHLLTVSMFTAVSCIQNIDFVSDKYSDLCEEYDSLHASLLISQVIAEMLEKFVSGESLENSEEFKKKIEELK